MSPCLIDHGSPRARASRRFLQRIGIACALALAAWAPARAYASTAYGDLNNFDVFNDTGQDCHGFEIELDDVHSIDITYTYDWNHYGNPTIAEDNTDPAHPKVFVRYAARYSAGAFSSFTAVPATAPAPTDGHMCTNPAVNFGCEHFGVGYYGTPSAVNERRARRSRGRVADSPDGVQQSERCQQRARGRPRGSGRRR